MVLQHSGGMQSRQSLLSQSFEEHRGPSQGNTKFFYIGISNKSIKSMVKKKEGGGGISS